MLLCLDVGNTQIHGGVFDGDNLVCQFRKSTQPLGSTDELGIFFIAVLRENTVYPRSIERIALCSVVPAALHPIRGASKQYFGREPFVLQAGVKTGLKVKYRNPLEVGADRIAGAIAASQRHPGRNLIIVDCGTATTFDVVTAAGDYLGGVILPGIRARPLDDRKHPVGTLPRPHRGDPAHRRRPHRRGVRRREAAHHRNGRLRPDARGREAL
jgi:type III pantothenate kinase